MIFRHEDKKTGFLLTVGYGTNLGGSKLQFIGEIAILGRALTKTFLHNPLMGANPIGFK